MGGLIYRAAIAIRGAIPLFLGLVLAAITFIPFGAPDLSVVLPSLTMPLVYYWTIHRPEVMPPAVVFAIGLWQDVLLGGPLGLMAFTLIVLRGIVETQRQVFRTQAFSVSWLGFVLISLGLTLLAWAIACWWYWTGFSIVPFLIQWGLGAVAYLPLVMMFSWLNGTLFERR